MKKQIELVLKIPGGYRIVGTRTEGDCVVCVCEPYKYTSPPPVEEKKIGFVQSAGSAKK